MILPLALLLLGSPVQPSSAATALWVGRSAELALACVHKEYPNKIAHVLNGDTDVKAPHEQWFVLDIPARGAKMYTLRLSYAASVRVSLL